QGTFLEDHALTAAARHADVRVPGFRRAVDDATHDRDGDRHLELRYIGLDRIHSRHHVVLEPPARGAGDEGRALIAEGQRLQDLVRHAYFFLWIVCRVRHQDRVADSLSQQIAETIIDAVADRLQRMRFAEYPH